MANPGSPRNPEQWPTLSRLAGMDEAERRRALRSHREAGFAAQDPYVALRQQLDAELGKLAELELRVEIVADATAEQEIKTIQAFSRLVQNSPEYSPAFAQYLNSYLYFKIRFAASRLGNPSSPAPSPGDWNERPVGLPSPPPCEGIGSEDLRHDLERFLGLQNTPSAELALGFLDGYFDKQEPEEDKKFDLWLRGLYPRPQNEHRFLTLAQGLYDWAAGRCEFYVNLEKRLGKEQEVNRWLEGSWEEGRWHARNPLAARCGVVDLYWLAKILCAEVSPRGVVRYVDHRRSWLHYLPALSSRLPELQKDRILHLEEVLRSVFDFACDLIQNAVEMAEYREHKKVDPANYPNRPSTTSDWRAVYDGELDDIANQRKERVYRNPAALSRTPSPGAEPQQADNYWSRRIRTGEYEENLVGLAHSGGGIRSATFSLGVLQSLKELDLLRRIDCLSTVSGGGYIGAWLLGNVRRTHYWLSQMTSWEESIAHLRSYSKYLSPQTGLLSADTWVIWGTWIRNAFLIQLTTVAWLASLLTLALAVKPLFDRGGRGVFLSVMQGLLLATLIVLAGIIVANFSKPTASRKTQHHVAALLAWIGSLLTAALLWSGTTAQQTYSEILKCAYQRWPVPLSAGLFGCLVVLAFSSLWHEEKIESMAKKIFAVLAVALLTMCVAYLALCGVVYVFDWWASDKISFGWYAYVFGPTLVLLAITLSIVVLIGLIGTASADWRREWWTRFGSWLAIYGAALLALTLAAVFGPLWVHGLFGLPWQSVKWGAVIGWIGSVIAALLAGNSSKTQGNGGGSSKVLEWVARIGGVLFIAGAVLTLSSVLRIVLAQVWLNDRLRDWWTWPTLNALTPVHMLVTLAVLVGCGALFSWRFNLNIFGLNWFYRNRLVRCYLGGTRWIPGWRRPNGFTGFDEEDDLNLTSLQYAKFVDKEPFRGPFPIINCSLNLGGSSDLAVKTRQSASFTLTPLAAGADRPRVGFAPIKDQHGFGDRVNLGQAISISGAAASPNMGYNTSPLVAVLLTMFNVRLGWWFPNPGEKKWRHGSPKFSLSYLIWEFLGMADEGSNFVNVSDGGHFENLGIYELIRRRVRVVIAVDGECDPELAFGSLGNVIRICETDFGAKIDIDVELIRKQAETERSRAHCAVGRIAYGNGSLVQRASK